MFGAERRHGVEGEDPCLLGFHAAVDYAQNAVTNG